MTDCATRWCCFSRARKAGLSSRGLFGLKTRLGWFLSGWRPGAACFRDAAALPRLTDRRLVLFGILLFPIFAGLVPASAATFTVTHTNDSGVGSLRWAITNANDTPGPDVIAFQIPGSQPFFTIRPETPLPPLTDPVTVDGSTQPGYAGLPRIVLSGELLGGVVAGLVITASNSTVRGLAIQQFGGPGLVLTNAGFCTVQANFIGCGPFGTNYLGNGRTDPGFAGILVYSPGNRLGGTHAAERNVISGSNYHGIYLWTASASNNVIWGNYIGTDLTGSNRLGNAYNGLVIASGQFNLVGGTNSDMRNVISGNGQNGIYMQISARSNVVQGNFIGTTADGNTALSNAVEGITITGSSGNQVGGALPGARNVISGNGKHGVNLSGSTATNNWVTGNYIGTDVTGRMAVPNGGDGVYIFNAGFNRVGGTNAGEGNLISGNLLSGIAISETTARDNVVQGNWIGTDATGTNALGNALQGIFLSGRSNNIIGGLVVGARNVISGNGHNGVWLAGSNALANQVLGNFIGTDVTGSRPLGNGKVGVRLEGSGNRVGGVDAAARNVISGNTNNGVHIYGAWASNNVVRGNFIGLDVTGTNSLGNGAGGVGIEDAVNNLIGGSEPGARNVIAANASSGIYLVGNNARGNRLEGNYIGTDANGQIKRPNCATCPPVSIGGGIDLQGAPLNWIGGAAPGAGNLIAGNLCNAISIGDSGASSNQILGNLIGTKPDGITALPNQMHGIELRGSGGFSNTFIGGFGPGEGNVIAYAESAGYDGVRVRPATGNVGHWVRANSIFNNGGSSENGLGIDLGADGVTANDAGDTDGGANLQQNFPVLTNVQSGGSVTLVRGTLHSTANSTFLLQFYSNPSADPSGHGEGRVFLGATNVTTDASGNVAFTVRLEVGTAAGHHVSATATDATGNTSEFAQSVATLSAAPPAVTLPPQSTNVLVGANVTFTVTATGTAPLAYQWRLHGAALPGATGTALTLVNVQPSNAGPYTVLVSNLFGAVTSAPALLEVYVPRPTLTFAAAPGELVLAWPATNPGFALQQTTNLTPPVFWSLTTNAVILTNGQFAVRLAPPLSPRFYRLIYP